MSKQNKVLLIGILVGLALILCGVVFALTPVITQDPSTTPEQGLVVALACAWGPAVLVVTGTGLYRVLAK